MQTTTDIIVRLGARFLFFKDTHTLVEGTVQEFSPSKRYVHLGKDAGWVAMNRLTVVEELPAKPSKRPEKEPAQPEETKPETDKDKPQP